MDAEFAELMAKYNGELRENYSGRSMYGSQTTGVTFESVSDAIQAAAMAGSNLDSEGLSIDDIPMRFSIDNMGLDIIIY